MYTALYSALYYAVTKGGVISVQCSTVVYSAVQCSAVLYSAVQCSAVVYSAVQCSAVLYSAVQCSAVVYSAVQCSGVVYSAVQCSGVVYSAVQCSASEEVLCLGSRCRRPGFMTTLLSLYNTCSTVYSAVTCTVL